jgi:HSP20 family protein
VDILETVDELTLVADVPGAKPEDIDIQYERGELAIRVKVDPRQPESDTGVLLREYGVGDYYRVFEIGEAIDKSRIHAEVHNGVLTLHLPKVEEAKPRKIAVKTA